MHPSACLAVKEAAGAMTCDYYSAAQVSPASVVQEQLLKAQMNVR